MLCARYSDSIWADRNEYGTGPQARRAGWRDERRFVLWSCARSIHCGALRERGSVRRGRHSHPACFAAPSSGHEVFPAERTAPRHGRSRPGSDAALHRRAPLPGRKSPDAGVAGGARRRGIRACRVWRAGQRPDEAARLTLVVGHAVYRHRGSRGGCCNRAGAPITPGTRGNRQAGDTATGAMAGGIGGNVRDMISAEWRIGAEVLLRLA